MEVLGMDLRPTLQGYNVLQFLQSLQRNQWLQKSELFLALFPIFTVFISVVSAVSLLVSAAAYPLTCLSSLVAF